MNSVQISEITKDSEYVAGKKTYYSISEVCNQTGLEPHVLRYWESEFPQLRPKKNRAGNRAYRDKDIEIIKYIKYLLYQEQYTIPGAKKKLSETRDFGIEQLKLELPVPAPAPASEPAPEQTAEQGAEPLNVHIDEIKNELRELLQFLKS